MKNRYKSISERRIFKEPNILFRDKVLMVSNLEKSLNNLIKFKLKDEKLVLVKLITNLDSLSPLKTLTRGYSVVEDSNGKVITSVKSLQKDDVVGLIMQDGKRNLKVL